MNSKLLIFFLVTLIILAAVFFYFYYHEEKKIIEAEQEYKSLNILAYDNDKQIITGYSVSIDSLENVYITGNTSTKGAILVKVPVNHTVFIHNINLKDQNYYSYIKQIGLSDMQIKRVELFLKKEGNFTFEQEGEFKDDKNILLRVTCNGFCSNVGFCIDNSFHIIKIDISGNFFDMEKPDGFKEYNKCYDIRSSMSDKEQFELLISYSYFNQLNDKDFIKLALFDNEFLINKTRKINYYQLKGG